jgi:hypothetical protein
LRKLIARMPSPYSTKHSACSKLPEDPCRRCHTQSCRSDSVIISKFGSSGDASNPTFR